MVCTCEISKNIPHIFQGNWRIVALWWDCGERCLWWLDACKECSLLGMWFALTLGNLIKVFFLLFLGQMTENTLLKAATSSDSGNIYWTLIHYFFSVLVGCFSHSWYFFGFFPALFEKRYYKPFDLGDGRQLLTRIMPTLHVHQL